ncbi:MAG: galactokinase [Streptosporangiales bacterium]
MSAIRRASGQSGEVARCGREEALSREVAAAFERAYGHPPEGVWAAPGRVNLIGDHTDYADGFVLPIALPQRTLAAVARRDDGRLRCVSSRSEEPADLEVAALEPGAVEGWSAYVAGVLWALRDAGHAVGGADVLVDGDVPLGAGLSSSAALECSVGLAYDELYGLGIERPALAGVCQRAENAFVGMPSGVLDQMSSLACTAGHALFLDCRSLAAEQVPLDLGSHEVLVVDTQAPHRLVDGEYAERRKVAERAASRLGVSALRDAGPEDVGTLPADLRPYARHVVTENARVLAAVERMRAGDLTGLGELMTGSHASLRDDYRVSCPELDAAVDAALAAGALGARMTGGGFGGSAIALVEREPEVRRAIEDAYATRGLAAPRFFTATAAPGAQRVT